MPEMMSVRSSFKIELEIKCSLDHTWNCMTLTVDRHPLLYTECFQLLTPSGTSQRIKNVQTIESTGEGTEFCKWSVNRLLLCLCTTLHRIKLVLHVTNIATAAATKAQSRAECASSGRKNFVLELIHAKDPSLYPANILRNIALEPVKVLSFCHTHVHSPCLLWILALWVVPRIVQRTRELYSDLKQFTRSVRGCSPQVATTVSYTALAHSRR